MHYFKLNIGDYHKKAGRLTMLEHGAYTLLLHACYDREKFPTKEEAIDWCWARTQEEIAAVEFVLAKFFRVDGDCYVQDRIREEIDAFHSKAEKNKHIALEREAKRRTNRARSVLKTHQTEHESPPNQEPRTINQEPIDKNKKAAPSVAPLSLPEWLSHESFAAFEEHRKKLKAPMTPLAKSRLIAELSRLREDGNEPVAVLDQSILNGWKGVFPLKNQATQSGGKAARQQQDKEWLNELTGRNKQSRIIDITPAR